MVECGEVERLVFSAPEGDLRGGGDGGADGEGEGKGVSWESSGSGSGSDDDDDGGGGVSLQSPEHQRLDGRSASVDAHDSRGAGMRKARNREMVRRAARRGVAFGFLLPGDGKENGRGEGGRRRWVDAVQGGRVVESSFAKGEWGVRWRDDS